MKMELWKKVDDVWELVRTEDVQLLFDGNSTAVEAPTDWFEPGDIIGIRLPDFPSPPVDEL